METFQTVSQPAPLPPTSAPVAQPEGSLLWWVFRDTATPLPKLADAALKAGLPTLYLPLPFPVAPRVAFRRGLKRATVQLPAGWGKWRADIVAPAEHAKLSVPADLEAWCLSFKPAALLGAVQRWEPRQGEEPWRVRLWLGMRRDRQAARLPVQQVLRVFEVAGDMNTAADITPVLLSERSVAKSSDLAMAHRVYRMIAEERELATAPEIGEGVMAALEDASGVKLRPGLCALAGTEGVLRAEAMAKYLQSVGRTAFGLYHLRHLPAARSKETGLVHASLEMEIEALRERLERIDAASVGVGALRTQAALVRDVKRRLDANATLLGSASARSLQRRLRQVERRLSELRKEKQQLLQRDIILEREAARTSVVRLRDGLAQLHVAAKKQDVPALEAVNRQLAAGQGAALAGGFAPLLRRLRKLIEATVHVQVSQGAAAARPLCKALESAATFLEARGRSVLATLPPADRKDFEGKH